jgi:riboflavin kinase/FMN adenylyltransferase
MTFDPHPSRVLGRQGQPVLTRLELKLDRLRAISPELVVVVQAFDDKLAQMSAEQFVAEILVRKHAPMRVIVGDNFRFGQGRLGSLETLVHLGEIYGFSAAALPLLSERDAAISSSRIRELLGDGDVESANALLGSEHTLWGEVVHGERLGRELSFPTANLAGVEELLPKNGVYAGWVDVPSLGVRRQPAVCNIGTRPTVGGHELAVEAHLMNFDAELYGHRVALSFVQRLRDERRFDGLDALRGQIKDDISRANVALGVGTTRAETRP